jgi:hypothetical protein
MRELEEEQPAGRTTKELTPEEEELLYGSDDEKRQDKDRDKDGDVEMQEKGDSEEDRRRKSEREAEEEVLLCREGFLFLPCNN